MRNLLMRVVVVCTAMPVLINADVVSKSYLTFRQRFEVNMPERLAQFRYRVDARDGGINAGIQAVGLYAQTTNPAELAHYFLPNGKDYIMVGEDASNTAVDRTIDVNAFHLGILTAPLDGAQLAVGYKNLTYQSIVSLCPQQTLAGVGISYQQRLPNHFWFDIAGPIEHIKNKTGLSEQITDVGGEDTPTGYFDNAIAALGNQNTARNYGRIITRPMTKTGLAFIEARIGRDIRWDDTCFIGGFVGAVIPTAHKPKAIYLFEPVLGNNGHVGFMIGSYGSFEIMRDNANNTLTSNYNISSRYLLDNEQRRSFDLRGKPWSRYMVVWKNDNYGVAVPSTEWQDHIDYLINYSTLCVRVKPYAAIDISVDLNYRRKDFTLDVGYDAYARKAEDVFFTHAISSNIGLPALRWYLDANHVLATESKATVATELFKINPGYADQIISQTGQNTDSTYLQITTEDLDPMSGAHPACLAYMVYGSMGYEWNKCKLPTAINAGISYEFSHDNTFVKRWLAWFKIIVSI
jgi:hypothetical protein